MRKRSATNWLWGLLSLCFAFSSTGCFWVTTKHEGNLLKEDLAKVSKKANKNEEGLEQKLARLEKTLEEASKLLTSNSANIGAEVSELTSDQFKLNGLVMDAKRTTVELKTASEINASKLAALETRIAALESNDSAKATSNGDDPGEKLAKAQQFFDNNQLERSKSLLIDIQKNHSNHAIKSSALFLMGQVYAKQKKWSKALQEFQSVYEKHPTDPLADDALWQAAFAAENLKWCTDARAYYSLLRQKYPKSKFAKKAKSAGLRLKKNSKNAQICSRS